MIWDGRQLRTHFLLVGTAWLALAFPVHADLPKTNLQYRIRAELDPTTRQLRGELELDWKNPGDRPVDRIPLHLYLNAFSHEDTTWMGGASDLEHFLKLHDDPWGWIELESLRQDAGAPLFFEPIRPDDGNPQDRTLIEVRLDRPIPPGGSLHLEAVFRARLPIALARTGGHEDFFLVAQWFPKLAAFETPGVRGSKASGFRPAQFHGPTEFYADFADFDVTLTVPTNWTVGATGRRVAEETREGKREVRYVQRAVHDFAFVAGSDLHDESHVFDPGARGPPVEVRYLVPTATASHVPRWRKAVEGALEVLGRRVGPYPYETLTVICPPYRHAATSGMEYPTLITGMFDDPVWSSLPLREVLIPELVLVHEFGHQYFYGLLASNEREDAYLDEGFNSYWEAEILREIYGPGVSGGLLAGRPMDAGFRRIWGLGRGFDRIREAVGKQPSWLFDKGTQAHQIYSRPALILGTAARLFGQETLDRVFRAYYESFVFGHPGPADFEAVTRSVGGNDLAEFLDEAFSAPTLADYRVARATSKEWKPPLGRLPGDQGEPVLVTEENRDELLDLGLDPAAREEDGRVLMVIRDPGWRDEQRQRRGSIQRRFVKPEAKSEDTEPPEDPTLYFESRVRLEGPARDQLPVSVRFAFDDGVVIRDTWDGRAAWRSYQFLRRASLLEVQVDPEKRLILDVRLENDARLVDPDSEFVSAWSAWLTAVSQWLVAGASLWL